MASHALQNWSQQGLVSLWRYVGANRSYRGWHLSADADGCQSLLALINAFSDDAPVSYRTVSLAAPSKTLLAVPGRMFSGVESASKLRLAYRASSTEWLLTTSDDIMSLTFGEIWRGKLRDATNALFAGDGDFKIGPEDSEQGIWFWWWKP
jgi:hypothetical protein